MHGGRPGMIRERVRSCSLSVSIRRLLLLSPVRTWRRFPMPHNANFTPESLYGSKNRLAMFNGSLVVVVEFWGRCGPWCSVCPVWLWVLYWDCSASVGTAPSSKRSAQAPNAPHVCCAIARYGELRRRRSCIMHKRYLAFVVARLPLWYDKSKSLYCNHDVQATSPKKWGKAEIRVSTVEIFIMHIVIMHKSS